MSMFSLQITILHNKVPSPPPPNGSIKQQTFILEGQKFGRFSGWFRLRVSGVTIKWSAKAIVMSRLK